jgi:hypothetical protein
MKTYRFAVPAVVCFTVKAETEEEAVRLAAEWKNRQEDAHDVPGLVIDGDMVEEWTGDMDRGICVYIQQHGNGKELDITADHIED